MLPMVRDHKDGRGRALFDVSDLTEVMVPDGEDCFGYFADILFKKKAQRNAVRPVGAV